MDNANPVSIPAEPGVILSKGTVAEKQEKISKIPYCKAVESLLFVARLTRPDIECAVNSASQFLTDFSNTHWNAVKIFRYLSETIDFGISFRASGSNYELGGYIDADYT